MFKLLTEDHKKKVAREYKLRRLVLIVSFFTALLLVMIIGLFPSYIISASRENEAEERLQILNQALAGNNSEDLDKWLQNINEKIKLFSPGSDSDRPYEAYKKIITLKPEGITLTELSYKRDDNGNINYTIGGTASDRRTLINFQNNLNDSSDFSNASVPISNLARDRDIDFTLNMFPEK